MLVKICYSPFLKMCLFADRYLRVKWVSVWNISPNTANVLKHHQLFTMPPSMFDNSSDFWKLTALKHYFSTIWKKFFCFFTKLKNSRFNEFLFFPRDSPLCSCRVVLYPEDRINWISEFCYGTSALPSVYLLRKAYRLFLQLERQSWCIHTALTNLRPHWFVAA